MHWFGFGHHTLWLFRKALVVKPDDIEGLHRLRAAHGAAPWFKRAQRKAWTKASDPERREKIAAAKRGKPRSPATIAKMRKAATGRKHTAATRAKMRRSARCRRGEDHGADPLRSAIAAPHSQAVRRAKVSWPGGPARRETGKVGFILARGVWFNALRPLVFSND